MIALKMTKFRVIFKYLSLFLTIYSAGVSTSVAEDERFIQAKKYLDEGIQTYNDEMLSNAKEIFIKLTKENSDEYIYPHYVALACLGRCDIKNFEIAKSAVKKTRKALKAERVVIAKEGLPFADKSIELNDNFSESYMVKGALISNRISGMISGMRNGSLAEEAIDNALRIDKNNPLARIENARMYINKPGILGGDINKGIEIIRGVIEDNPELEAGYINLGIAYIENGNEEAAINTFERLQEIKPHNPVAQFYLDQLQSAENK